MADEESESNDAAASRAKALKSRHVNVDDESKPRRRVSKNRRRDPTLVTSGSDDERDAADDVGIDEYDVERVESPNSASLSRMRRGESLPATGANTLSVVSSRAASNSRVQAG
jgi:hypothetical protein